MSDRTDTPTAGRVAFTTWRDIAHGKTHVKVHVNGYFAGELEMSDRQLLTFANFISPPQSDSIHRGGLRP